MLKSLFFIVIAFLFLSCSETYKTGALFISHPNDSSKKVEYFIKKPLGDGQFPAIFFIHGHQTGLKLGGKQFVDWGVLDQFVNQGFIAVAISQPGYGGSDGPPDYCGTFTQNAVIAVIEQLESTDIIKPNQIILEGISRGAIVAGLVAAKKKTIKGIILISGVYDFKKFSEVAYTDGSKQSIISSLRDESGSSEDSLLSRSVLYIAKNIKAHTLIINGENDDKTIASQAVELANEINKYGGNASFFIFKNTGHQIPIDERNKIINPFVSKLIEGENIIPQN